MSHVKNVQAFEQLKGFCTGYGGTYNPGKQNLQVNALTTLLNNAQLVLTEVQEARTAYERATNSREVVFREVPKLATRIHSTLKCSGAHPLTLEDARVSIRKLRGIRASKPKPLSETKSTEGDPPNSRARGQDYASMVGHFEKLVETVSSEALYQTNDLELSVEGLEQKRNELQRLNTAVMEAVVQLGAARTKLRNVLYTGDGSLVSTAMATKFYLRSLLGYSTKQFAGVSKLQFHKPNA
jgi:hypothetical protein